MLQAFPIPSPIFTPGKSLEEYAWTQIKSHLQARDVVVVTSKIVSLAEGRLAEASIPKDEIVRQEADEYLCTTQYGVALTIKHGLLIPSAGIDESNSQNGQYILFPQDPYASAERLHTYLRQQSGFAELGVVISDSHTHPLRRGVTGIALAHWGFKPVNDFRGQPDLFGRTLQLTSVNVLDALTVAAVLTMGEAGEARPLAIVRYPELQFAEGNFSRDVQIPRTEDLFGPLLRKI